MDAADFVTLEDEAGIVTLDDVVSIVILFDAADFAEFVGGGILYFLLIFSLSSVCC